MPTSRSASSAAPLSRRAALTGVVAASGLLWAGCTTDQAPRRGRRERHVPGAEDPTTAEPQQDPDVAVAALALADERAVLDALTATISRHSRTRRQLSSAVEVHRAHIVLLSEATPPETTPAEPTASATSSPDITDADRVPRRAAVALTRIADLEGDLSIAHKRHAFAAQSGPFARLLASMAASSAQQAVLLRPAGELS